MKRKIFITEDTYLFKQGEVYENFTYTLNGVLIENNFINKKNYIVLKEKLSSEDEKRVREIIKQQLSRLLWNMYTKQNVLVS